MQHLLAIWKGLTPLRRLVVLAATVGMFAAVLMLSRQVTAPKMSLLYSGLDPAAAGEVIAALEQRGVAYEVREGAIFADRSVRDELRLTLAAEGLPANGNAGYELLDSLSGFGTTSQMFDAAYWRAKEGELARTIAASPAIRSARVHIAMASTQGFRRASDPSASVAITPAGEALTPQQARAVRYLVASAVAGLSPDAVSVIDAGSGVVLALDDASMTGAGDTDRARELKRNVERLLEARVGPGKAVVEVSIDWHTDREQITERRFDPDSRVAISTENEERTSRSNDSRRGSVTVASNLPDGDAQAGGGASSSQDSETRERVNYEVSETQREIVRGPGGIRRLTVAVLVDGVAATDQSGNPIWEPRPEDEMAALRELVASAVGYDESRGDVVTIKSMPFGQSDMSGGAESPGILSSMDVMSLIQLGVLALVGLVLGLFVVRPILAPRGTASIPTPANGGLLTSSGGRQADPGASTTVLTGEIEPEADFFAGGFPAVNPQLPPLPSRAQGADVDQSIEDPVARLRRLISERREEAVGILRDWIDVREEKP